jgi:hypothetical protein
MGQQCTFIQLTVVLRVVSLLEVYRLTLVPHLPSGDQTPAHFRFTLIVVPVCLLSTVLNFYCNSLERFICIDLYNKQSDDKFEYVYQDQPKLLSQSAILS